MIVVYYVAYYVYKFIFAVCKKKMILKNALRHFYAISRSFVARLYNDQSGGYEKSVLKVFQNLLDIHTHINSKNKIRESPNAFLSEPQPIFLFIQLQHRTCLNSSHNRKNLRKHLLLFYRRESISNEFVQYSPNNEINLLTTLFSRRRIKKKKNQNISNLKWFIAKKNTHTFAEKKKKLIDLRQPQSRSFFHLRKISYARDSDC